MTNKTSAPEDETVLDRINAAIADEPDPAAEKTKAADKKAVDPKARMEKLFAAVSSEFSSAGDDTDKLKELRDALSSQASLVSRVVEAAIGSAIAMSEEKAREAAAKEPPAKPAEASANKPAQGPSQPASTSAKK